MSNKKHEQYNDYNEALGYLNRGGHYFDLRNDLRNETIIMIANDIYNLKNL